MIEARDVARALPSPAVRLSSLSHRAARVRVPPVVRKTRRMPAVISTIALIAGCGSSTHAEVSGVVVDARTGRAIPGARVFAQDGSATRTDADGRFTLSVSSGDAREIRASAAGRVDVRTRIDVRVDENASIVIELVSCSATDHERSCGREIAWDEQGAHDPDAVVRWIDDLEEWLVRGVREPEADVAPAGTSAKPADVREGEEDVAARIAAHHTEGARCAQCHDASATDPRFAAWGPNEQWALGAMSLEARAPGTTSLAGSTSRAECASCHDASAFAAAHGMAPRGSTSPSAPPTAEVSTVSSASPCAACHDGSSPHRFGLRVYESVAAVGGAPAGGLGSGAVCVECHRGVDQASAHSPQADVVLGRGARTVAGLEIEAAPHGAIADACVACHTAPWRGADAEALALGHTFAVREAGGSIARDACSSCHGDVPPESIARGDWDDDGMHGTVAEEHDRAIARVRGLVEARIRRARITARCGTAIADRATASGFREREGAIVLVDVRGVILGDCDGDDVLDEGERATTIDALPRAVRDAAWDLMLLEHDGSRGVHNPAFAFGLLGAIESRL